MEKRVYNGQEIKPARLELGVGPAGGKPEMLGEEKGGGESRGGEHYLNHNLKISTLCQGRGTQSQFGRPITTVGWVLVF